jgi:pyruvate formate lyase activating enzyme
VWIRVPVVPCQNDGSEDLHALGKFLSALPKRYPVWLLPYHTLGAQKHERLGVPEPTRFQTPSPAHVEACAEVLRGYRLEVLTRKTQ